MDKKTAPSGLTFFIFGLVGALLLLLLVGLVITRQAVNKLSEQPFVLTAAGILNLPAAKINGLKVGYVDYIDDLQTLRKFYSDPPEGLVTPTAEQISDQVISRLVANRLIEKIARDYKVTVTADDLSEFKTNLLAQFGDEAATREELQARYGWTLEKYLQKVVTPIILEQKMQSVFAESADEGLSQYNEEEVRARHILFMVEEGDDESAVKSRAEEVLQRIKAGEDFAVLAQEFGSDSTKDEGGDLGWFGRGMMVPEFEEAVFALESGQLADEPVRTQFGFHLVKLDEKRTAKNFFAFMDDQFKNAEIKLLIPINNPFENL